MSCIIGLITKQNEVTLAADNQSTDQVIKVKSAISKIVVRDTSINSKIAIGCVGGLKIGNFARYALKIPNAGSTIDAAANQPPGTRDMAKLSHHVDNYVIGTLVPHFAESYIDYCRATSISVDQIDDGLLIGMLGRLYYVDSSFGTHVSQEDFEAIGSTRDLTYGAIMACQLLGISDPYKVIEIVFDITSEVSLYSNGEYEVVRV